MHCEEVENHLREFIQSNHPKKDVAVSVMDLSRDLPQMIHVSGYSLKYPASVTKLYMAAGLMWKMSVERNIKFTDVISVSENNAIDTKKEIMSDPRPLLEPGMKISLWRILHLMLSRSDNTAANCLIDLVGRPYINTMLEEYGWKESAVTRKFLPRSREDGNYVRAPHTLSCTNHLVSLMTAFWFGNIGSKCLSQFVLDILNHQLDRTKMRAGLPDSVQFYHKTGWNENREYPFYAVTGEAGIAIGDRSHYAVACLCNIPESEGGSSAIAEIGRYVHSLMESGR